MNPSFQFPLLCRHPYYPLADIFPRGFGSLGMDLQPKLEPKLNSITALSPSSDMGTGGVTVKSDPNSLFGLGGPSVPLGDTGNGNPLLGGVSAPRLGMTSGMLEGGIGLTTPDTTSINQDISLTGGAMSSPNVVGSHYMSSASGGAGMRVAQASSVQDNSDRRRHWCVICGDRASGKHYGVYSCEGCKGFFKRTVRKDLTYHCRENRQCVIDRRQRNRCQFCRYEKCLATGMRREAVQEERMRARERSEQQGCSSGLDTDPTGNMLVMPLEQILEAELAVEPENFTYVDVQQDPVTNICHAADKQLFSLVEWSKRLPHFKELSIDDQVNLLKASWNELLIAAFSYRSTVVQDAILLATGLHVHRDAAKQAGVGTIFDRILVELVAKMRDLKMDRTELGCLRAIVLFNPDAKGISARSLVERLREKVYSTLEEYCRTQYPEEPGRFAKLLLRLPALRSLGLKCLEHLFFFKLMGDTPIDTFLTEMLDTGTTMDD